MSARRLPSSAAALLIAAGLAACQSSAPPGPPGASAGSAVSPAESPAAVAVPAEKTAPPAALPGKLPAAAGQSSFRFPEAEAATVARPGEPKARVPEPAAPRESPLSLTASDGTGLKLVSLEARGVVEEPLAFTELQLAFENPQDRVIEGRFQITLPQGATISRFAMKQGDRWQEGEVVERQAAARAYEDFLHRRQDPALLEQQAGNEFSARVFPIPARGVKELIVSYSQELVRDDQPYRIHLRGLPELGALHIRVLLGRTPGDQGEQQAKGSSLGGALLTHQVIEVSKRQWVPDRDFEVQQVHAADRLGLRNGNLVVARITPILDAQPEEVGSLFFLIDTSASRALGHAAQVELVGRLIQGLQHGAGPDTPLGVACFDQVLHPVFAGRAGDFGAAELEKLRARRPLGASNLQAALTALPALMNRDGVGRFRRVLLVTDGVATAGEVGGDRLLEAVQSLRVAEVERLDVLAVGGIRDDALLARLVNGGLAKSGTVVDAALPLAEIARKLTRANRTGLRVAVDGAAWVWPVELDGVQAGDQVLVYADLPAGQPFALSLDGVALAADRRELAEVERPLLERAWVKARISRVLHQRDTLAAGDTDLREALRKQVIELSVRHRVLSPYTALLVLETEQDYARFGIDRHGLADILTVGPAGIDVVNRSAASMLPPTPVQVAAAPQPAKTPVRRPGFSGEAQDTTVRRGDVPARARRGDLRGGDEAPEASTGAAAPDTASLQRSFEGEAEMKEAEPVEEAAGGLRGGGAVADVDRSSPARPAAPPPPPAALAPPADAPAAAFAAPPAAAPMPAPAPVGEQQQVARIAVGSAAPEGQAAAAGQEDDGRRLAAREEVASRTALRLIASPRADREQRVARPQSEPAQKPRLSPYTGPFQEVMDLLARKRVEQALSHAGAWLDRSPGDVMALVALGEALEASGEVGEAARAYGSLIDLFPSRADMRRFAGERLERLQDGAALDLAIDTYRKAAEQRPDHPASHRLLAFALLRAGKAQEAFRVLVTGSSQRYPAGRFAGVDLILREDLGLAAAAWIKNAPAQREEILGLLRTAGGSIEDQPSLRFVLNWETDANDVDFHIHDGKGGHAYYQAMHLPSGGELYADVTTGYGPECFTIRHPPGQRAYPYRLQAHYYSRGPMGYGMGKLQIIEHDGQGRLSFEERPFVVMQDQAFVELGTVRQPLRLARN